MFVLARVKVRATKTPKHHNLRIMMKAPPKGKTASPKTNTREFNNNEVVRNCRPC